MLGLTGTYLYLGNATSIQDVRSSNVLSLCDVTSHFSGLTQQVGFMLDSFRVGEGNISILQKVMFSKL